MSKLALTLAKAWDLYDNCYKVAKEAPDDFRQLVSELGSLQGVLKNLRDDINSDKSYIKRLDADRNESLERFLRACFQTLRKLQKLMVDFKVLGIDEGINFWKRIKWVAKKKTVTELKSQIQAHTIRIQLCMSDIGNVQLARIETRIDQALERQEATTEDDDVPLLDAPLEPCTSSMTRQRSSESEPASGPVRRFTGKTLVDNKSSRPKLVDSGQSSDDSELSTVGPPTPSPRKTSDLSRRRTSSMKSGPQMLLASQLADYDDGSALDEKSSNGLLIQIDEDTVPQSDFTGLDRGRKGESDTYLRSILDSAVEELASVRQKERQSRPLRLPDRQRMPKPDEELKKRFEQSAKTEMEYRKLNTKDWLKIGTWWLLKSQFHSPLEPMGEPSCPQGSISTSYCSTTRHAQAYIDLVKASWILFDVILESDYEIPMQADENRKLFRELADVSVFAVLLRQSLMRTGHRRGLQKVPLQHPRCRGSCQSRPSRRHMGTHAGRRGIFRARPIRPGQYSLDYRSPWERRTRRREGPHSDVCGCCNRGRRSASVAQGMPLHADALYHRRRE